MHAASAGKTQDPKVRNGGLGFGGSLNGATIRGLQRARLSGAYSKDISKEIAVRSPRKVGYRGR